MTRLAEATISRQRNEDEFLLSEQSLLIQTTNEDSSDREANLNKVKNLLYVSHFIATFAELGWQFCLIIFLSALTNNKSFTLVATYGLFTGLVVFFMSSSTGAMIDNNTFNRLQTVQLFIWVQNLSVVIASTCCFFLLRSVDNSTPKLESSWIPDLAPPTTMTTWMLIIFIHIFGALGNLTDQSMTVALERDWIVVISKVAGQESEPHEREIKEKLWLMEVNTIMKQIDLVCKVAAPAAAGIFFGYFDNSSEGSEDTSQTQWDDLSVAAVIIGIVNLISLLLENFIIVYIYEIIPLLAKRKSQKQRNVIEQNSNNQYYHKYKYLPRAIDLYLQQPISFGGLAAAILYLNILSFGTMMTAYLVFRGMSYKSIGLFRGLSSVIGLMGTFAYRISTQQYSLTFTGSWSIILQLSCLSLSFASIFISNDNMSLFLLIIGVIVSRVGLYSFKLTITQMMQQMIAEDMRGTIGGVQKSLNSFFDLATYGLGLVFPKPEQFYIFILTGFTSVGVASFLFIWGIHKHGNTVNVL